MMHCVEFRGSSATRGRAMATDPKAQTWRRSALFGFLQIGFLFRSQPSIPPSIMDPDDFFSNLDFSSSQVHKALEATKLVLDIISNKRTDAQFLERMMLEIEGRTRTSHSQLHVSTDDDKDTNQTLSVNSYIGCANGSTDPKVVLVKTQETDLLVELLGKNL
ncbi:hypothetical protein RHGRI_021117 [Rhododendron griersonianum]|uniref:Uncharacterized protein n=1 Tax=Rhododendron griersonianum TaxID=479676 RepID=A0AAV6JKV4_9ERIC|nr:hypothetical protein RHGRI_021117 [Rhododendron griersonianum]KAG5541133.1 hypothetical protein RHGRI_021117 [Rhododendron griersonianum]